MKRKVFALLLTCVMLVTSVPCAMGAGHTQIPLSQLTEECMAFIDSQGISVPKELQEYEGLAEFVKDVIVAVENNSDVIFAYNYVVTLNFANEIKAAVNAYYGNNNAQLSATSTSTSSYSLIDSETVGVWEEIFTEYNCYAYALGYTSSPNNSYFAPEPGYFSSPGEFNINGPISVWADQTEEDLREKGYSCIHRTTDYTEIMEYSSGYTIICLRKGDHPDFHYMRWSINSWYHKPGNTHILRYLYYRPDLYNWTNEASFRGIGIPPTSGKYYSDTIYYFAFRTDHNLTNAGLTGNNYHDGSRHYYEYRSECEDCGASKYYWESQPCAGPPCAVIMGIEDKEAVIK